MASASAFAGFPAPAHAGCPNDVLRSGASATLPDCRAYEMVTPVSKPAGVLLPVSGFSGGPTADGEHYFFDSNASLIDNAPDQPWLYRADRGTAGWVLQSPFLTPPVVAGGGMVLNHFDEGDLSTVVDTNRSYDSDDTDTVTDLYSFNAAGDVTDWLSRGEINNADSNLTDATFAASTPDASHVLFYEAGDPLLTADLGRDVGQNGLYEATAGGLRLVAVDNSDVRLTDGDVWLGGPTSSINALSRDGSKIFFTALEGNTSTGKAGLYVRESGQTTVAIPPSPSGASADSTYLGASADGSKVFFASPDQLTPDDTNTSTDLYEYDLNGGSLKRLSAGSSGADVELTPVYSSDNGSRVYFVATGDLVPGKGTPGGPKTFLWDNGELKFVADADVLTDSTFLHAEQCSGTRLTSDGRYLLFESSAQLSPADTDSSVDVYRYDAVTSSLTPASQGPVGGNGPYGAFIDPTSPFGAICDDHGDHPTDAISSDGRYVFFETAESLVPQDTNGKVDVYEHDFASGETHLLSSGTGASDSHYLGSTPSGSDVFILTSDRLLPQDQDSSEDIYDARIDGGFPPPPTSPPCSESDCQGPASVPPTFATPASVTFSASSSENGRLSVRRISRAALRRLALTGRITLRVSTTAAGRIIATAHARLGKRSRTIARSFATTHHHASTVPLRLRLSSAAMKLLRRRGSLGVTIIVAQAGVGTAEARFTLRLARREVAR